MKVSGFAGSVLDADADAIVNAANTELRHGGGVAAAIAGAAGPALQAESRAAGYCPLGSAVATGAGRLGFRCVLHVPTIDYRRGRTATPAEMKDGVHAALRLAGELGCRRVAFPVLGAGVAGLAAETACRVMAKAFDAAPAGSPDVLVCAFSPADRIAVGSVFGLTEPPPPA